MLVELLWISLQHRYRSHLTDFVVFPMTLPPPSLDQHGHHTQRSPSHARATMEQHRDQCNAIKNLLAGSHQCEIASVRLLAVLAVRLLCIYCVSIVHLFYMLVALEVALPVPPIKRGKYMFVQLGQTDNRKRKCGIIFVRPQTFLEDLVGP